MNSIAKGVGLPSAQVESNPSDAEAGRLALLIGNSNYGGGGNDVSGVEDANKMAEYLRQLHFTVTLVTNGTLGVMTQQLKAFGDSIGQANVVIFFYSGHGFQMDAENYLLPVDGSVAPGSSIPLATIKNTLAMAEDAVKLVFLDACRDEKRLANGLPQGLNAEQTPASKGSLYSFAAGPGATTPAGLADGYSPYSTALRKYIRDPGLTITKLLDNVRADLADVGQLPVFVVNDVASDFCIQPPVLVGAEVEETDGTLFVVLNGEVVLNSSQQPVQPLSLKAGENDLILMMSNGRTFHNNHDWETTQGWSYKVTFTGPNQAQWPFGDGEGQPFRDGPHHGGVFTVARASIVVDSTVADSSPLAVQLENREDKVWNLEAPFWARDQDLLYEVSVKDLPLDKLLDPQRLPDFGVIPAATASLLLRELLTTGKILNQQIADPANTFFTVRGNTAFKDLVQVCIKDQEDDRVNDFFASIKAALNRQATPFDAFINGLNGSLQQLADASTTLPAEAKADAQVWTAIEDRSTPPQPAVAPGSGAAVTALPASAGLKALKATSATSVVSPSGSVLAAAADPQDPLFQKQPDEIFSVAIPFSQTIQGVPLTAQAYAFFAIRSIGGSIRGNVRVVADLSDLQGKIGSLVDLIPLPTNQCAELGAVNNVVRIWGKTITIDGAVATLELQGDVDGYFCTKGVPCSKVVWNGFVPEVVIYDCNPPITQHVFNQPFDATLPFSLGVADPLSLELTLGQPTVSLGGQLAGITNGILQIAGVNLNDQLKTALSGIVNPDLLKGALPADLAQLDPVVTTAGLFSNAGALAASVELNVPFDIRIFKALADAFAKLGS